MAGENQSQTVVDPYEALVAAPASSPPSSAPTPSVASTSDSQDFSDYEKIVGASPTPKPSAGLDPYEAIVAGPNPQSYNAVKDLETAEASSAKDPALENWLDSMGINDPKERALFNADKPQGERPPFALGLAGWIDSVANTITSGRAGNTAEKLVQEGTYEPAPGEPSFMNAGIPPVPPQKGTGAQLAAGAANVPIGFANFLLSPGGIATVEGIGLLPKVAQTLTGIGFTVQQARDFFRAKTLQEKITTGVGAFLLGLGTAVHAKQKPIIAKPTPPTPTVEGGEPNAVPIESTGSVGAQPAGNESLGRPAEGGGVGPVEPGIGPAGEIDPYEAIVRREASGERPPTETSGLPPQAEEPIISAGATAAGEPRTEGGDNVAAVETPQDRKARLQYERELIAELGRTQRAAGDELVAAVIKAGGLPGKKSQYWSGELAGLYENDKAKRIFRTSAKAPDITATELTGFDFQTSGDLIAALEDRFRTGKKHYPTPREIRDEASIFGFGPGAAAKGELDAAGRKPIRMVNADIDAEREARGVEPLMSAARRANPLTWDEAMARIDHTPEAPQILVDNLNSGKIKSVNRTEQAMLLHEEIRLRNEKAMEAERSVDPHTSEDERAVARGAFDALEARLDATERANREAGSASGAALQIRQMAALDDYTYAAMETRARNAKGTPLTLEESAELQEQAAEIERLQGELAKFEDADARAKAMETLSNLMRETFKESKAQAKAGKSVIDILHVQRDAAIARSNARKAEGRLYSGVDPEALLDATIIGASHIADGIKNIGDFTTAMVKSLGEGVLDGIESLYQRAKEYYQAHSKLSKPRRERPTPVEKIAAAVAEGGPLTNQMVFELAREHVRNGVEGLDNVIAAVHADLEPSFPGLTERQVRDAFTDYGKITFPSRAEDAVKLREYRRLGQLQSAIEDVLSGEGPKRTGKQRDQPSQVVRDKMKELNEAMRKAGFEPSGPEELASPNKARETALRNQIADIERELATGERAVAAGKQVADSPLVKGLRERRDVLKKKLEAVRDLDPEVRAAKEKAALEAKQRQLGKTIADLKGQKFAPAEAGKPRPVDRPAHPVLESLMQERDKLRADLAESRKKPDAQKAEEKMQRRLQEINDRVNEKLAKLSVGDVTKGTKPAEMNRPAGDPRLEEAQQALDRVNAQLAAAARTPPALRALKALKTSLATRVAEAERRIREGDYEPKKRAPGVVKDAAANQMAGKLALLKRQVDIGMRRLQAQRDAAATPAFKKIVRGILDVPRAVAIGFHGTVGMVSHVGANIFRPSQWFFRSRDGTLTGYWPNFFRQFKLAASKDYHERIVGQIVRNPDFLFQKRAGLAVDPAVTYTDYGMYSKILEKVLRLEAGKRGFDVLKLHRQEMFDRFWKTVPDSVKLDPEAALDMAKNRAMAINHGTGVISRSQSSFLSKMGSALDPVLFASRLEASRWARIIGDPVKTAATVLSGSKATLGERSVASARVKAAVEFTAFYMATLVANNALQKMIGGRPINFTNPASPENDWLKHKVGGQTVMMDGGLLAPVRLIGLLVAKDMLGSRKELRGDTRTTAAVKDVGRYFLGKVNPAISIVKEQVTGEDFSGRQVPFSIPKLFGAQPSRVHGKAGQPVSTTEYLFSHGPIPASGATREIFDDLRNRGMSAPDAMALLRGAAAFAVESTGVRVGADYVPRPSHSAPVTPAGRSIIHQIKVRR